MHPALEHRAHLLSKFYAGLKFEHEARPKYIFDGKSRSYYEKFHPDKKIKTIFILGLGYRSYRPIVGASPGTYYLREGGTAANKAAATGPGSDASACMSFATHNAETFAAGDLLLLADDGGDFRTTALDPPSAGSGGSPIIYQPESGDSPRIDGSELITGWTVDAGNRWQASHTPDDMTDIGKLWLDGIEGIDAGSQAAVDAENEWHYDTATDTIYLYSTTDPDTAFTSPGVEAPSRQRNININENYITIDGIDCEKGGNDSLKCGAGHSSVIKNLTVANGVENGLLFSNTHSNPTVQNVIARKNGIDSGDHGFYQQASAEDNGSYLYEDCVADENFGYGFHMYNGRGGTARRCIAFDCDNSSGFLNQTDTDDQEFNTEYCIAYNNAREGYRINTVSGNGVSNLFNCVGYGNNENAAVRITSGVATAQVIMKNCILFENVGGSLEVTAASMQVLTFDNNCHYQASGTMIKYDTETYTQAQFATYQSEKSQDANGISSDPLFMNAAGFDFNLKSNSPCIEAGTPVTLSEYLDFDKKPLGRGINSDIGAFETLKGGPRAI